MEKILNNNKPSNKGYLLLIILLTVIHYINGNAVATWVSLFGLAILAVYTLIFTGKRKKEWRTAIEELTSNLDLATANTLSDLPFPLIIVNKKGDIIWYNDKIGGIFKDEDIYGENIKDISLHINIKQVIGKNRRRLFSSLKIKDEYYDIHTAIVNSEGKDITDDTIIMLYFYNVTDKYNLIKEKEETRQSIMLIEVDNLTDALKSIEEEKAPLLAAEIERQIQLYAQKMNAVVKKYENSKYILSVHERQIREEIAGKFGILDTIRDIDLGNNLAVTLSIGVGRGAETPQQSLEYATIAKDLALGRGGDQAVVKEGEKLLFFGGKTQEVAKSTKVRARVIAHALVNLIDESDKVVIMGHSNPDADCIGSAIGLKAVISQMGKEAYIVLDEVNPSIESLMEEVNKESDYANTFITPQTTKEIIEEDTLLIIVDVQNKNHLLDTEIEQICERKVVIDHHRKGADHVTDMLLAYVETYASSTCELVAEMIPYMIDKPKMKEIEAVAMLSGICIDTKNFHFKTGVRTFEAAAFLRKLGADTIQIKKLFTDDLEKFAQRADIIKSAEFVESVAIAVCPEDTNDTVVIARVADELLNISGVEASFVLAEMGDKIIISARSLGEVNVQVILEQYGGGGHMTMAGAAIENKSMINVYDSLKNTIDMYLREVE